VTSEVQIYARGGDDRIVTVGRHDKWVGFGSDLGRLCKFEGRCSPGPGT
jgi:hypothetical protein